MIALLENLEQYLRSEQHPRTSDYLLSHVSVGRFFVVIAVYLLLSAKLIPYLMRNKQPFRLEKPIFVYNVILVVANIFFFCYGLKLSNFGRVFLVFDYHSEATSNRTPLDEFVAFVYLCSKFFDWLDTLFFALRKKDSQLTFLHLFHHSVVPFWGYIALRLNPFVPAILLFTICNSFVHTVMYSYYALAIFSNMRRFLWWKRYITQLQLVQFLVFLVYASLLVVYQNGYPKVWLYIGVMHIPFFIWMFASFYRNTYRQNKNKLQ